MKDEKEKEAINNLKEIINEFDENFFSRTKSYIDNFEKEHNEDIEDDERSLE